VTGRHDLAATLPWLHEGTAHLLRTAAGLDDDALRGASRLPGWTRAHVLGHVARNAEALTRLATWARTGVETPMYPDPARRAAEIEESARQAPATLRAELESTSDTLASALGALTPEGWQARVRSALGRDIPAAEIPWIRIREVWLHPVDLGTGAAVTDLPAGVVDLLLDDVTAALSRKDGCPSVTLAPTDRPTTWSLGAPPRARRVDAPAADLVGWLTGRVSHPEWPALPGWL
jgi:maleylpyruvate isomerase